MDKTPQSYCAVSTQSCQPIIRCFISSEDRDVWISRDPEHRRAVTAAERVTLMRRRDDSTGKYFELYATPSTSAVF